MAREYKALEPRKTGTRNWVEHLVWDTENDEFLLNIAGLSFNAKSFANGDMVGSWNINTTISIYELMTAGEYGSIEEEARIASNAWDLYISDNGNKLAKQMFKGLAEKVLKKRNNKVEV